MGKRSTSRRLAMQAIYQAEVSDTSIETALQNLFAAEKLIPATEKFAVELALKAWGEREASDRAITKLSKDWPLDRLGKVDHSILRLALCELRAGELPASVVIDEAVEIAKKYSSQEAAKFINGILGAYLKN